MRFAALCRIAFVAVVVLAATVAVGRPSPQDDRYAAVTPYEKFNFNRELLTKGRLAALKKADSQYDDGTTSAAILRGIIFGKHGRIFVEKNIQEYLEGRPWYRPNPKFSNAVLTDMERKNLDIVRGAEAASHGSVLPGDLRFWMTKPLKVSEDLGYSISDIRIMEAEVEAIHGRTFPSEPLLQKYFDERYWYKRDPNYKFTMLSKREKDNLSLLSKLEKKVRGTKFFPQDVILYADKPIPASLLKPLDLYDLRLTRNAIYAARGRRFKTPWINEFFANTEWYSPLPEGQTEKLTAMDQQNLATVVKIEQGLHDELSEKPVPHDRLTGLFVEDLRKLANEIPARHGEVFKDRAMQGYFASLPWYKPDPSFSLKKLSKIERKNYEFLLDAAKKTTTQFNMEEG